MPYVQYSEQAILNSMFGNAYFQGSGTITAPAALTTVSIRGTTGSGNADVTPVVNGMYFFGTPGSGATQNQYTNPDVLQCTGSPTATSLTITSQTVGKSRVPGDFAFYMGLTTAPLPAWTLNTLYIGLSVQAISGATAANVLTGEPTSTGSYARIAVVNNRTNFPAASAASPSVLTCGGPFSFAASTAAWSTTSTNLQTMFIADASTLAGGNVLAVGALGTPQAVNAASITLSFASGAITVTLT